VDDASNAVGNIPLIPELRILFWAILCVIVPFGLLLYFLPGDTAIYWAWEIIHPRSAILIGAGYFGAVLYYIMLLKQNDWLQAVNGMGGLVVFCLFLLVATMMHWDEFRPYHPTTLVWLLLYYVGPVMVPIAFRRQRSAEVSQVGTMTERELPAGWRLWLIMRGFFYAALAILWLFTAPAMSSAWPWMIGPLELQVFSGQLAIIGWSGLVLLHGGRSWRHCRPGLLLSAAIGLLQVVGLLFGGEPYYWTTGLGIFLPLMFLEWIVTPVLGFLQLEKPPVVSPASR
jgi:hypothetical protein